MFGLAALGLVAASLGLISGDEILARVSASSNRSLEISYSGRREYRLRNLRFSKDAKVVVQVTYTPGEGKQFEILERSGTPALTRIVERILRSESEESRPPRTSLDEIGPSNYSSDLQGTENISGRPCYVVRLRPKHKNKYLIDGTVWVDANTFGVVRLQGATAVSVSMWVGTPHITEDFRQIRGLTFPSHLKSLSSTIWLGTSELEIRYLDYQLATPQTDAGSKEQPAPGGSARIFVAPASRLPLSAGSLYVEEETRLARNAGVPSSFVVTPKITTYVPFGKSL